MTFQEAREYVYRVIKPILPDKMEILTALRNGGVFRTELYYHEFSRSFATVLSNPDFLRSFNEEITHLVNELSDLHRTSEEIKLQMERTSLEVSNPVMIRPGDRVDMMNGDFGDIGRPVGQTFDVISVDEFNSTIELDSNEGITPGRIIPVRDARRHQIYGGARRSGRSSAALEALQRDASQLIEGDIERLAAMYGSFIGLSSSAPMRVPMRITGIEAPGAFGGDDPRFDASRVASGSDENKKTQQQEKSPLPKRRIRISR